MKITYKTGNNKKKFSILGLSLLLIVFSGDFILSKTMLPIIIESPLDALEIAINQNPEIKEKKWALLSFQALEKKAQRSIYPTLEITSIIAPIYKIDVNEKNISDYEKDYYSWGPLYNFQGYILQPIYTFGRYQEGKKAAYWGVKAKIAEKNILANQIKLRILKYYWGYQLTLILHKLSKEGINLHKKILNNAQKEYDKGSGKITIADISRLHLFGNEIQKEKNKILLNQRLAIYALKREMGLSDSNKIAITEKSLNLKIPQIKSLQYYLNYGKDNRKEFRQLKAGIQAFQSLKKLSENESYPIIALAGKINATYTKMRKDIENPFYNDPYNKIEGGIGLGIQWKFDSGRTFADSEEKAYKLKGLIEKKAFAALAIPLEIRKAYLDLKDSILVNSLAKKNVSLSRKWALKAQINFDSGLSNAKDLLEALTAYFKSRIEFRQSQYQIRINYAELARAIGNHTLFIQRKSD